ncbi:hypothetical protein ACGFOM_35320 [Streptomyces sp. NPDC048594]
MEVDFTRHARFFLGPYGYPLQGTAVLDAPFSPAVMRASSSAARRGRR